MDKKLTFPMQSVKSGWHLFFTSMEGTKGLGAGRSSKSASYPPIELVVWKYRNDFY